MQHTQHDATTGTSSAIDLREQCIRNCSRSLNACLEAIQYCLEKGGDHVEKDHMILLQTCAISCRTTVDLMSLHSEYAGAFCEVCAEVCKACADSCEDMDGSIMEKCAAACRESQQSCERMGQTH